MCVEPVGVPPLLPADQRAANDRIPPHELTQLGPVSYGHVAVPEGVGTSRPIHIQCHERYGVVRHTVELADRFAERGFVTVAPDFYADVELTEGEDERLPDIPDEAVLRHIGAAIEYARSLDGCDENSPVAVTGVCRSGSWGLVADAAREDIDAVVLLYGGAQPREYQLDELRSTPYPEIIGSGTSPILGIWGEKDHTMSLDDVRGVRGLIEDAGREYEFTLVAGMPHGWLNDTMPGRFHSEQAEVTFEQVAGWLGAQLARPAKTHVTWKFEATYANDYDFSQNERKH